MLFVEYWSRLTTSFLRLHWVFIASAAFLWVQHVLVNYPQSSCCNSSLVKHHCKAQYAKGCSGWWWYRGSALPAESSCWVHSDQLVLLLPCSNSGMDPGVGKFCHPTPEFLFLLLFSFAQTTTEHQFLWSCDRGRQQVPSLIPRCSFYPPWAEKIWKMCFLKASSWESREKGSINRLCFQSRWESPERASLGLI